MVYKLRPLKVKLDFEDRAYRLGDGVRLRVGLEPGSDVEVREGRVDLVCEERWTEVFNVTRSFGMVSSRLSASNAARQQAGKKHREKFVHSSVGFLQETRLQADSPSSHDVRFQIQPEPPPHTGPQREEATVKWWLVATIDIVRGRNPRTQRVVQIALPPASSGGAGGKLRMSRPKKPTGPSSGAS